MPKTRPGPGGNIVNFLTLTGKSLPRFLAGKAEAFFCFSVSAQGWSGAVQAASISAARKEPGPRPAQSSSARSEQRFQYRLA